MFGGTNIFIHVFNSTQIKKHPISNMQCLDILYIRYYISMPLLY